MSVFVDVQHGCLLLDTCLTPTFYFIVERLICMSCADIITKVTVIFVCLLHNTQHIIIESNCTRKKSNNALLLQETGLQV